MLKNKTLVIILILLAFLISACTQKTNNNFLNEKYNLSDNKGLGVSMPIYSGRADSPHWIINNETEIIMIKEKLSSLKELKDKDKYKDNLGGFRIFNRGINNFPEYIRVIGGVVFVREYDDNAIPTSSGLPNKITYYEDKNYELEKLLLRIAKKEESLKGKLPKYVVESEL
ncbi:hypothetical protein J4476_02510 [Candidatus Woesearchaeota archaeon]|nr:MAG: hypothetical protein QT09_C0008G0011 [archaeon GW2011_AR18]MBS3161542.1 hypothetical protein [Candidatus Woesearchaeota archaeon]HIH25638.1 hypothetical protein [Nanoarchaeota archaeon]